MNNMEGFKPIEKKEETVSYLGVELPKALDTSGAVSTEKYSDFIEDEFTVEFQKKVAVCFKTGEPILIEGGTSIGKTTAVRKMCAELGYEVHYINLNGATDVEDLMGRYVPNAHREKLGDSEYVFADGKVTSGLRQEKGKIKVIILDEFNAAAPNIVIRLHEVLDALERGGQVTLSEDASEIIDVDKTKTHLVGLMNPPGGDFTQRESLDPAQLRRWVYQKEADNLPTSVLGQRTQTMFGLKKTDESEMPDAMFLSSRTDVLSIEALSTIPGLELILAKYDEFHERAKELVKTRKIAKDQPQAFTFDDNEERRRVRDFVLNFYQGDITKTMQEALRYYYSGKVLNKNDRAKMEELIKLVEYSPKPADPRRKDPVQSITPDIRKEFGKLTEEDVEKITVSLDKIWRAPYEDGSWSLNGQDMTKIKFTPEFKVPADVDFQELAKADDDEKEFGKYITNPETLMLDFESLGEPKIYDPNTDSELKKWLGEEGKDFTVASVMEYVAKTFSGENHLPGIEYQGYLFDKYKSGKAEEIPASLKDGNYYFFPGSAFRYSSGSWLVPFGRWGGGKWRRNGFWPGRDWNSDFRVVLLGK